jgi:hypothetical protein
MHIDLLVHVIRIIHGTWGGKYCYCLQVQESFNNSQLCTTDTDPSVSAGWYKWVVIEVQKSNPNLEKSTSSGQGSPRIQQKFPTRYSVCPVTIQWTHPSSRAVGPDGYPAGVLLKDCHKNYSGTRIIRTSFGQILLPQSSRRDVWEKPSDPTARSRWGVH